MIDSYNFLTKEILRYGDTVVVGCSGGPDSMALLHLLLKIKKEMDIAIICCHVNHNVRKESITEMEFLRKYCLNHGVEFEAMTIKNYGDDNFHNEARTIRYTFFNDIVKKYNAKYLMTAHHGDDLMETILMRIVRGSTLKGYSGFSKIVKMKNYSIVRPLINVTKEEIAEYDKKEKIPYVIDSSNVKDKYTRNRYRKVALPFLKSEDPLVHQKFLKFSNTLLEYNDYIDKEMSKIIKKVYSQKCLNIEEFLKLEKIFQNKVIYLMLEDIYQDDLFLISDVHVDLILKLINSRKANSYIYLPNNIKIIKSYDTLNVIKETEESINYDIEIDEYVALPNGKFIKFIEESKINDNFICRLNSKDVSIPLHVRTRKNGDKMIVKGMMGHKKLNDIFINSKIPMHERDMWPVVVDSNETIVWLPGLKKSNLDVSKTDKCDIILKYY
ncbi:MAG TPA: tRNA lysidine(34) synthetase TilS [Bacilli bacterium]|nr:tRNA lysidine(34) synthetase TilS [Bacilli bacterium]